MNDIFFKDKFNDEAKQEFYEPSNEDVQKKREARKLELENNPHYLKETSVKHSASYHNISNNNEDDFDSIPVAKLNIPVSLKVSGFAESEKYLNISKDGDRRRHKKLSKKKKTKKSN